MNKMSRQLGIIAVMTALIALSACAAFAVSFQDEYDFDDSIWTDGVTYRNLASGDWYAHDLSEIWTSGVNFESATLSLTYMMNSLTMSSVWYVDVDAEGTNINWWFLGQLNVEGVMGTWTTDSFDIPDAPLATMSNSGLLVVKARRNPDGVTDSIMMDKSVLSGEYRPNPQFPPTNLPECGTLMLAAMGLTPLGFRMRKRR